MIFVAPNAFLMKIEAYFAIFGDFSFILWQIPTFFDNFLTIKCIFSGHSSLIFNNLKLILYVR